MCSPVTLASSGAVTDQGKQKTFISHCLEPGSPKPRCQQIQHLVRVLPVTSYVLTWRGESSEVSPYKGTNPITEPTLTTSSDPPHLPEPTPTPSTIILVERAPAHGFWGHTVFFYLPLASLHKPLEVACRKNGNHIAQ